MAEAKNRLPELIKLVESGESITICRHGLPVVDLVPTKGVRSEQPAFGTLKGRVRIIDSDWWLPMSQDETDALLDGPDRV